MICTFSFVFKIMVFKKLWGKSLSLSLSYPNQNMSLKYCPGFGILLPTGMMKEILPTWTFQRDVKDSGTYAFRDQTPQKFSKTLKLSTLTIFMINVIPDKQIKVMQKASGKSKTYSKAAGQDLRPGCPLANTGQIIFLSFSLLSVCCRHEWSVSASPSNTKCPQTTSVQTDE